MKLITYTTLLLYAYISQAYLQHNEMVLLTYANVNHILGIHLPISSTFPLG